jgi:hypothetical protein
LQFSIVAHIRRKRRLSRRSRKQSQAYSGTESRLRPGPDYGEKSYTGSNHLLDKKAIITGGDSGSGSEVAFAFAREGADVRTSYLNEDDS